MGRVLIQNRKVNIRGVQYSTQWHNVFPIAHISFITVEHGVVAYLILEVLLAEHGQDGVTSDFILGRCNNTTLITTL